MTRSALAPGSRLGRFEVEAPLGAGGMGEVYRARDTVLDRQVAIKVLPSEVAQDPQALARFAREAKAVAALSHPNILALYDFGQHQGIAFAVMELLDGETLRDRVARGPLTWRDAAEIALATAQGLAAAHAKGIVHRDLKPENLFLTQDGRVKILDFGLARQTAIELDTGLAEGPTLSGTVPGTVLGTLGYMSPEQARGELAGPPSDLFSLGCVLYEMLAGRRAFTGHTGADRFAAILRDDPLAASPLPESVDGSLRQAVAACLEKTPARRPTAADLVRALQAVLASTGQAAVASALPAPRNTTMRRAIWTAAIAGAVVLAVGAAVLLSRGGLAPGPSAIRSLAVLPLANLSGNPEEEFFADGMTDELITQLTQLKEVRVISRTSAMRFKGSAKSLSEIARTLNVQAVVEGSVARDADKVRITAKLVDTARDENLWAQSYERDLEDVLALQGDVARDIAREIQLTLTPQEAQRLAAARPVDPWVHEQYLRGLHAFERHTPDGFSLAIEHFRAAIERDPTYAAAHAGLAHTFAILGFHGILQPADAYLPAEEAALKAVELDPQSAEAHAVLGRIAAEYEWDWTAAEMRYRRAIALNPDTGRSFGPRYSNLLAALGRFDEALREAARQHERNPVGVAENNTRAYVLYLARRYDAAMEQYHRVVELEPDFTPAHELPPRVYEASGRPAEAFARWQAWARITGLDAHTAAELDAAYAADGLSGYWRKRLQLEEREMEESGNAWPLVMAGIHARLGQRDAAMEWLERAVAERQKIMYLGVEPVFDPLRGDPRFKALLERLKLPNAPAGSAG